MCSSIHSYKNAGVSLRARRWHCVRNIHTARHSAHTAQRSRSERDDHNDNGAGVLALRRAAHIARRLRAQTSCRDTTTEKCVLCVVCILLLAGVMRTTAAAAAGKASGYATNALCCLLCAACGGRTVTLCLCASAQARPLVVAVSRRCLRRVASVVCTNKLRVLTMPLPPHVGASTRAVEAMLRVDDSALPSLQSQSSSVSSLFTRL